MATKTFKKRQPDWAQKKSQGVNSSLVLLGLTQRRHRLHFLFSTWRSMINDIIIHIIHHVIPL